jgi:hypothetical protein
MTPSPRQEPGLPEAVIELLDKHTSVEDALFVITAEIMEQFREMAMTTSHENRVVAARTAWNYALAAAAIRLAEAWVGNDSLALTNAQVAYLALRTLANGASR